MPERSDSSWYYAALSGILLFLLIFGMSATISPSSLTNPIKSPDFDSSVSTLTHITELSGDRSFHTVRRDLEDTLEVIVSTMEGQSFI